MTTLDVISEMRAHSWMPAFWVKREDGPWHFWACATDPVGLGLKPYQCVCFAEVPLQDDGGIIQTMVVEFRSPSYCERYTLWALPDDGELCEQCFAVWAAAML